MLSSLKSQTWHVCLRLPVGSGEPGPGAEDAFRNWVSKCYGKNFDASKVTAKQCADLGRDACGRKGVACNPDTKETLFKDDSGETVSTGSYETLKVCYSAGPNKATAVSLMESWLEIKLA